MGNRRPTIVLAHVVDLSQNDLDDEAVKIPSLTLKQSGVVIGSCPDWLPQCDASADISVCKAWQQQLAFNGCDWNTTTSHQTEPHPALQGRLHEIAQAYQSRGWHVHFYPFAAHTRVGTLLFQQQDGVGRGTASRIAGYGPKSWWPFSWEDRSQQVTVQTIDLADFISSLPASSVVLMKLDIEGAEFDVVPRLAERGLLCKSSIPEAFIEVHESSKFSIAAGERFIEQQLDLARNSEGPCEHTVLNVLDDESFAKDVDHDFAGRTKPALRLSPEDGHSYMFGYFDKWAVDESNQRVLACRIPYADQEPSESAEMVVGFVPMDGTQQFTELGKTTAWNLQQGAMAEWLGPQTVIFNIRNSGGDGKSLFQAQVVDAKSGETWLYPRPVYALNRPRDRFLSLSFQRLHWLYRGYGYTIPDSVPEKIPEDDGLWEVDLGSQHEELLISVRGLYDFLQLTGRTDPITGEAFAEDPENAISGYWYLNHAHVSSEGSKVAFLFRSAMTLFSDSFDFTSLILGSSERNLTLTRESGSRFRTPPEAEIPKLLKTKLFPRS
eukprot:s6129_g5.t1